MSIQKKHVNTMVAAHGAALELRNIKDLSKQACVAMFYALAYDEAIKIRSNVHYELVHANLVDISGSIFKHVIEARVAYELVLQASAGANLEPCRKDTRITEQGHKLVKGRSKVSKQVLNAEKRLFKTGFKVNPYIWDMVNGDGKRTKEEVLVLKVLSDFLNDTMYFPVSYDYRGRMYYRAGVVTPQGNDMQKGLLMFAEPKAIGTTGKVALQYSLIDACGIKGSRVEQLMQVTDSLLNDAVTGSHGYLAAALAKDLIDLSWFIHGGGLEADYQSSVVCHQDATCSGLQIAAAITGDRETAEHTNCTERAYTDVKADVYGEVADALAKHTNSELGQYAQRFGRDLVKTAVMTMGYGAGQATLVRSVQNWLMDKHEIEFDMVESDEDLLMACLIKVCGASNAVKVSLQKIAEKHTDLTWATHDGFEVIQEKMVGDIVSYEGINMEFDKQWDEDSNITAIAPNFVHSLDAAMMRDAVAQLPEGTPVACIHDSLGTRACDYIAAGGAVRQAFVNIDARRVTERFMGKFDARVPFLGDYNPAEAAQSAYFWC